MNIESGFLLGEFYSVGYGIILTKAPPIVFAQRDVEPQSVIGRSGDLIVDKGRYKNVTIPYECAIIPAMCSDMRQTAIWTAGLLCPSAEYRRLENTFDPDRYRMARVSNSISVESIVEKVGKFTLEFDCKPQRFLKSGEFPKSFTAASALYNPTTFPAMPKITVYGSGSGNIYVGGTTVKILQIADQIILDSELGDAYRQVGDGPKENKNSCISAPTFPELLPGENSIRWDGGITGLEIIPRWWTL